MPVEAEDDLRRLIDSGEYEALHNWHGTMVVYCEAIECWNDPEKCEDEKQRKSPLWRRFMACAFSLECG